MRRTFPSLLCNLSRPKTQSTQGCASGLLIQTLLAPLPDFLPQRQSKLKKSREAHIRLKSMNIPQQAINYWINA
jgi:hypothetical protein